MKVFQYLIFTIFKKIPGYTLKIFSTFVLLLTSGIAGKAETLPKGFNQVLVATGINSPTVMSFSPDGRLFVAEQTGALRIIKNGTLLSQPFITLTVNSRGERGLLGIAFDPNFKTNKYIYLYYTDSSGSNNRISRFTANGDVAVPKSEVLVLNLSPLSRAVNHNGGNMLFGKDGKLYVGVGDNANSDNAQNLDTYMGKVLRINPDGSAPADNPFTTGSEERKRIWAYGMRNPYTLAVQPVTGRILVNDVGQDMWEEINDCTTGGHNYGWPLVEGMDSTLTYTNPVYVYGHGEGSETGCAISGGTFFNPSKTNYPSSYTGKYFFLDFCSRWINVLSLKSNPPKSSSFASSVPRYPVGMATGPDGNLYFLSRVIGAVYKITYTVSNAPVIDEQPQNISVAKGKTATFSVKAASTDSLVYQWRKNGVNINKAINQTYKINFVHYSDSGKYSVVVSNSAGSVTSNEATLTVTAPNQSPDANILTPVAGTTYGGGDEISFSGSGTDTEDGTLTASAFKWFVVFHHDTHTHPGPTIPSGIKSGSFTIPDIGETSSNVFYRLYLVVTDSQGASDTSYSNISPRKSTITIKTKPVNLLITLDGQPHTAPYTVTSVEGMIRTIGVITRQGEYKFASWSNGGDTTQSFATPVNDVVYTADFSKNIKDTILPIADAYVRAGVFADTAYGADTVLYVKQAGLANYKRETYLKFNISSFGSQLSSAVLSLYGGLIGKADTSLSINAYNVTDTLWSEATINWNNRPFADTSVLATKNIDSAAKKYYEWNLTEHIKNLKKAGVSFVTIKLVNSSPTLSCANFNSKEASENKPQLMVNYSSFTESRQSNSLVSNEKLSKKPGFSIYPNPATNSVNVSADNYLKSGTIRLYDINGKLIKNIFVTNSKTQQIYTGDLKNGIYTITISDGKSFVTKKLIIAK